MAHKQKARSLRESLHSLHDNMVNSEATQMKLEKRMKALVKSPKTKKATASDIAKDIDHLISTTEKQSAEAMGERVHREQVAKELRGNLQALQDSNEQTTDAETNMEQSLFR